MSAYNTLRLIGTAAALTLYAAAATAQTPVTPQPSAPNMPAPTTTVPEKIAPGTGSTSSTGSAPGTLSDRLERTDGVIRPPAGIDSAITVVPPSPNPSGMPIIAPPGSPGGNPNVVPK